MVLEQTLYPSWSSIFDSFYEFHWIYKAKEWQFKTFLAKDEKFCLDAFTVSLYNHVIYSFKKFFYINYLDEILCSITFKNIWLDLPIWPFLFFVDSSKLSFVKGFFWSSGRLLTLHSISMYLGNWQVQGTLLREKSLSFSMNFE